MRLEIAHRFVFIVLRCEKLESPLTLLLLSFVLYTAILSNQVVGLITRKDLLPESLTTSLLRGRNAHASDEVTNFL